jgi:hypothetical protein
MNIIVFKTKYLYNTNIHTYHSRFISEGVAETFQIFLRDTYHTYKTSHHEPMFYK